MQMCKPKVKARYMTTGEAAQALGLTKRGATYLTDRGKLRAIRMPGVRGLRLIDTDSVARLKFEREGRL